MRNVDARLKLIFVIGFLTFGLFSHSPAYLLCQGLVSLGLVLCLCLPKRRYKVLMFPISLATTFLVAHTFLGSGVKSNLILLGYPLAYSTAGLLTGSILVLRVIAGVMTFFWFANATEFPEIKGALAWLRIPAPLVAVTAMTWRYLAVYEDEVERMRKARTLRLGFCGWREGINSVSAIGGQAVIRAFNHSERTYLAMRTRGYNGITTVAPPPPLTTANLFQATPLLFIFLTSLLTFTLLHS